MKYLKLILIAMLSLSLTACTTADEEITDSGYSPSTDNGDDTTSSYGASIEVYDFPEVIVDNENDMGYLKRSEYYTVEVSNTTDTKEVYVIADRNQFQSYIPTTTANALMTNHNNTAGFSFSGDITIKVKRLDGGSLDGAEVYPKQKGYNYSIESDHLAITLSEWAYIYVKFPDMDKEPLFIFADPKETDVPLTTASNVELITSDMSIYDIKSVINSTEKSIIYFSPGVYNFAPTITDNTYPGYQIPLLSDKSYYIAGGAVIIGSFYGDSCANSKMYGRGIISACGKYRCADDIPYTLYMQSGGSGNTLEGIHFNCPAMYAVLSRNDLKTSYCKMFGWWYQTDGWGSEDNGSLENCFIKANDDFVKVYRSNQTIKNIVFYKQINGAAIQLGWNAYGSAQNSEIDGLYIVGDDKKTPGTTSNTAVINLVNNAGSSINNVSIKNVYVECDYQRLLGLNLNEGSMSNLSLENIVVNGTNNSGNNYISLYNGTSGSYSGFSIKDLVINDEKITSDEAWNLTQGELNSASSAFITSELVEIVYE